MDTKTNSNGGAVTENRQGDVHFVIFAAERADEIRKELGTVEQADLQIMTADQIEQRMDNIRTEISECLRCHSTFESYVGVSCSEFTDEDIECVEDGVGELLTDLQDYVTRIWTLTKEHQKCTAAMAGMEQVEQTAEIDG